MTAEPDLPESEQRARAVRTVAACAHDAEDLAELLEVLGLRATEARPQRMPKPRPAAGAKNLSITDLRARTRATSGEDGHARKSRA